MGAVAQLFNTEIMPPKREADKIISRKEIK
jgi:hypothetical protein